MFIPVTHLLLWRSRCVRGGKGVLGPLFGGSERIIANAQGRKACSCVIHPFPSTFDGVYFFFISTVPYVSTCACVSEGGRGGRICACMIDRAFLGYRNPRDGLWSCLSCIMGVLGRRPNAQRRISLLAGEQNNPTRFIMLSKSSLMIITGSGSFETRL